MAANEETTRIENDGRSAYHGRMEIRFAAMEKRIAAVEVDLAIIRSSFATRDDVQRIIAILHEHSLELANQRADFRSELAKQREEFKGELAAQKEYFTAALAAQKEHFTAALAEQREYFNAALAKQQLELHKAMMGHIWKLYGSASLLIAGVYFIARYVP